MNVSVVYNFFSALRLRICEECVPVCVCDCFFQALDSFARPDRAKNHTRQKLHASGLLRLEVRDGGVGRVRLPWKAREKDLVQASLLASGSSVVCATITPAITRRLPSVRVSVSTFPFYEDTAHTGPSLLHMTSS